MSNFDPRQLAIAVALVVSCAGVATESYAQADGRSEEPESSTVVRDDATEGDPVEEFLRVKFEEAKTHFAERRFLAAFRLSEAILVIAPDVPFRDELRSLRRRAEARYLGQSILTVHFESETDVEFPTEKIRGSLVLENVAADDLIVGDPGESGILGQAQFHVINVYGDGAQMSNRGTRVIRVSGFELEPGAVRRIPIEVDTPGGPGVPLMQVLVLDGAVRPTLLQVGEEKLSQSIPWRRSTTVLLPEELRVIDEDPYEHLQLALLEAEPTRFLVASRLWRVLLAEDGDLALPAKERTIDLLVDSLVDEGADGVWMNRLIIKELEELVGARPNPNVDAWRRWAKKRKSKK